MSKKILLVSHQLDFSGAPVALFYLAKALIKFNWSIDLYALSNTGGLRDDFIKIGVKIIEQEFGEILLEEYDSILFNTVVTSALIPQKKSKGCKIILWIHESPFLAGFAWSNSVKMQSTLNVDLLIFPTVACKYEWESFIDTTASAILQSPVDIPEEILKINQEQKHSQNIFCIIDPRESYRNIGLMEQEILKYDGKAIFNFVGTEPPTGEILSSLQSKKNVKVNYFGRVSRIKALEILAKSNIYWSATCLATQNRGLCEALVMNKSIYISRIRAHLEIGTKAGLKENAFFFPLGRIELNQNFSPKIITAEFLSFDYFCESIKNLFK